MTFAKLAADTAALASGLIAAGITREMRCAVLVPPSRELFTLTFALFRLGAVPVMIDPGIGIKNLSACLAEARPEAFIGIPKAQLARRLFGWARGSVRKSITVGWWAGKTYASLMRHGRTLPATACARTTENDLAAILFTSGSTGVPKGAVYTHGNFAAQIADLREMFAIVPGEIDLCTFPLFALFAPALGMTAIIPRMDFTRPAQVHPRNIVEPIQSFGATNLFGSPALLDRLGRYCTSTGATLPSLKRVLTAGAPVAPEILVRMTQALSRAAQVFTPYGATESLPVTAIGSQAILSETRARTAQGAGTCVGRPAPRTEVRIIAIDDCPIPTWSDDLSLPAGQIGEIVVRGAQVTREYLHRADHTAKSKIADPSTGRWWHRMGDVGYLDESGRLWFCGRKSQRVVTPQRTMFTECCEGIFNTHEMVRRSALVGVSLIDSTGVMCVQPILCIEPTKRLALRERNDLRTALLHMAAAHPVTALIERILFHPAFPVDIRHNSKIFREKLAMWAAEVLQHHPNGN